MKLFHILSLARKEFLALMRDRRSRIIIIVPPIIQLFIFGFAATYDLNDVPVAVYSEDSGGASRVSRARRIFLFATESVVMPKSRRSSMIARCCW